MTYSIDIINQFIDFASKNTKLSLYSSISNISIKILFIKKYCQKILFIKKYCQKYIMTL